MGCLYVISSIVNGQLQVTASQLKDPFGNGLQFVLSLCRVVKADRIEVRERQRQ